jgi:integrase
MAAIYPHTKGGRSVFQIRFTLYLPDGSRKTRYRYRPTKTEATELCRRAEYVERGSRACNLAPGEIIQALHDGLITEEEGRLFSGGRAVAPYSLSLVYENYVRSNAIICTNTAHVVNLRRADFIVKWLHDHPIPFLSEADVKAYIMARRTGDLVHRNEKTGCAVVGVSDKTIRNEMEVLHALIDEAVALGMVTTNVSRQVAVPYKQKRFRRAFGKVEIQRVIDAAGESRHLCRCNAYFLVMFALYLGLRRAELRGLVWDEDVDLESGVIKIQAKEIDGEVISPKSGEIAAVTIPDRLLSIIKEMPRKGRYVFGGAKPLALANITNSITLIVKRAGLPEGLTLHNMRHTYVSWLLKKSGDLRYTQESARHRDIKTTMQYAHVITGDDDPARGFNFD